MNTPCPICGEPWIYGLHESGEAREACDAKLKAWRPTGILKGIRDAIAIKDGDDPLAAVIPIRRECVCDSDACVEWCDYCATLDETAPCPVAGGGS